MSVNIEKHPPMEDGEPIAVLSASLFRRVVASGVQAALGGVLLFAASVNPPSNPVGRAVIVLIGLAAIWQSVVLFRATAREIHLTTDGLVDSTGRMICPWSEIASVERGAFAVKPSNGFVVRTRSPQSRAWVPGLWWRIGHRVGIGGTTSGAASRAMADLVSLFLNSPEERKKAGIKGL